MRSKIISSLHPIFTHILYRTKDNIWIVHPLSMEIIFDFGNVLATFDNMKFIRRLAVDSGRPTDVIRETIYGSGLAREFESGRIDGIGFYHTIKDRCGIRMDFSEFSEHFNDIFTPVVGMDSLLHELKKDGHRLHLLSNTNEVHYHRYIKSFPGIDLMDNHFLSYQMGTMKPDPRIFQEAIGRIGCDPRDCIFIDDMEKNIETARSLGIIAIMFKDIQDVRYRLDAIIFPH